MLSQNKPISPYRPTKTIGTVPELKDSSNPASIDQDIEHDKNFDIILKSVADMAQKKPKRRARSENQTKKLEGYQDPQEESPTFAEDVMSRPVVTLSPQRSIAEAIDLMQDKSIRHLPLVEASQQLVGIVSERDLIRQPAGNLVHFLGREVITSGRFATIGELAGIMVHERLGCLPVVEEHGELIGIVTRTDILKALIRHGSLDLWT